jgi:hypothetical protein
MSALFAQYGVLGGAGCPGWPAGKRAVMRLAPGLPAGVAACRFVVLPPRKYVID